MDSKPIQSNTIRLTLNTPIDFTLVLVSFFARKYYRLMVLCIMVDKIQNNHLSSIVNSNHRMCKGAGNFWSPKHKTVIQKSIKADTISVLNSLKSKIELKLWLYSLCYAKTCNKLEGPISASLRPGSTTYLKNRRQAFGNTVLNLTHPLSKFPHQYKSWYMV